MPSLFRSRRFASLPGYPAGVNEAGFCRDIGFLFVPSLGFVDQAQKTQIDQTCPLTYQPGDKGQGAYPVTSGNFAQVNPTNFSLGYTLFALASGTGNAYEQIMDDDLGGTRGFQFRFNNTGGINFIPFTNADGFASVNSNNYSAEELARGVPVIGRVDAAGNIAVFGKGGKFTGSLGAAPRIPGNVGTNPGVRFYYSKLAANPLRKPIYFAGALNRVITDDEAWAFLNDPIGQVFKPHRRVIYFDVVAGGGSTKTLTTSLSAAIQAAQSATASFDAAVQQANTLTVSLDASISQAKTLGAGIDAAILMARTAQAGLDAVIQAAGTQTATTSFDAAIQQAKTAQAALDAAISAPQSAGANLNAVIQQAFSVSAGLDGSIQHAQTRTASLDGFVLTGSVVVASLDAAIRQAKTAAAGIDAAIQRTVTAAAGMDASIAAQRTASAALNAYVYAGLTAQASLDAAILVSRFSGAGMNAYIQDAGTGVLSGTPGWDIEADARNWRITQKQQRTWRIAS